MIVIICRDFVAGMIYSVVRHSKEDEEMYKELMEVNNELIPHLLKSQGKFFFMKYIFLKGEFQFRSFFYTF